MSKCEKCKKGDLHLANSAQSNRGIIYRFICDKCGELKEFTK